MRDAESRYAESSRHAGVAGAGLAVCCFLILLGLLGARQAHAFEIHTLDSSFPTTGISTPTTIAVDEATGDIYVLDLFSGEIGKYTAAGTPSNWSALGSPYLQAACASQCNQLAVDNSGGANQGVLYVSNDIDQNNSNRMLNVYLPSGKEAEGMRNQIEPYTEMKFCGVATDRSEHVYLGHNNGIEPGSYTPPPRNFSSAHVQRFKPGAWLPTGVSPEPQIWPATGTMFGMPIYSLSSGRGRGCRIGSSSDGDQYFSEYEGGIGGLLTRVEVFRGAHEYFNSLPGPDLTKVDEGSTYFAIDQATDDAYFDHETEIVRRDEAGDTLERFGSLEFSLGVAVNSVTGTVYAVGALAGEVQVFITTEAPDVAYDPEKTGATTAELAGTVGTAGAGNVTDCKFEWGLTTEYTEPAKQCTPDAAGTPFSAASTPVSANLSGLAQETTYHYRISATNANGTTQGLDRTFTTHNVSDLSTDPATEITKTTATLNGSWTNAVGSVDYEFEWGPTKTYGQSAAGSSAATGVVKVAQPITGLVADTPDYEENTPGLYHYRIVATGPAGTTVGPDRTFTTDPPDAPSINGVTASDLSSSGVTLSAQVNPNLGSTFYLFEYGSTPAYGTNTPSLVIGSDGVEHPVSQIIAGLLPGTTYHFRAVATNFGGTTLGADQIFTTPAAAVAEPPPVSTTSNTQTGSQASGSGEEAVVKPRKCRKGFVKRNGKCVKKKRKKRHHRHRSHNHG